MKFLMINGGGKDADTAGPFYVFKDDGDGPRTRIYDGPHEGQAYLKIIEHAGVNVQELELDDFMRALAEGKFDGVQIGSEGD